ncbi:hypothetical protein ACS8YF_14220 [Salinisphaera sp. SWV1]|uniref:hypothetical protein n=1 Tax=Salinisphaera sp. SWV1 TaxID=3454139 RepID=UPI003F86B4FE
MRPVYTATEDMLSAAVIERLVEEAAGDLQIAVSIPGQGYGGLQRKLPELIRLAHSLPVILLTDLDRGTCAPSLIASWCGRQAVPPALLFRVAIREVEAWLLADDERFATFAGVPRNKLSEAPETFVDPKQTLLNLVWRHSPTSIKDDIAVYRAGGPRQGLSYNDRLIEFVRMSWRPGEAAHRSDSLRRAFQRIQELAAGETA